MTKDNVQNCYSNVNIPSLQTCVAYQVALNKEGLD
jgi:hypothetical protein